MKKFLKNVSIGIVTIIVVAAMLLLFNTCENFNNEVLGINYMGQSTGR